MSEPHEQIRWKYETDADAQLRLSRRSELGIGLSAYAIAAASAYGTHISWENAQPALVVSLAAVSLAGAHIGSRFVAQQINDGISFITNRFNRDGV